MLLSGITIRFNQLPKAPFSSAQWYELRRPDSLYPKFSQKTTIALDDPEAKFGKFKVQGQPCFAFMEMDGPTKVFVLSKLKKKV